ncbi:galactose-6-phosphate isomerase subunit LacA [Aerococcaceae bacterium DSM 111020]|nr:galactose-6-phosphate isomerase subunit LacA [Aerococcaceae bacterium DSM 111020]
MKVYLGSDKDGLMLKNVVKEYLETKDFDVIDKTPNGADDFVDSTVAVAKEIMADEDARGILIDKFGAGSFIAATKMKGVIAAEVSEERSAYMTREHNNAKIITMGQEIVGEGLAKEICKAFLDAEYDGGRHQIRVDMLNAMC